MKDKNYEFHVGDEVETVDGTVGKIVSICRCERCAERGFFEPRWETPDGKDSDYITVNQVNWGFPYYRRIGKYVWNHNAGEEESTNKNTFTKEKKKMKEIKLTIDGKEVQLTDEQLRLLGVETRPNPFGRTGNPCGAYFYIDSFGSVSVGSEEYSDVWRQLWNAANYFNDKTFAKRVALRQLLDRKLLKYAYDNGYEGTEESNQYYVNYCPKIKAYTVQIDCGFRAFCTHFSSYKATERAIKEVVEPFMKEHPDFVW